MAKSRQQSIPDFNDEEQKLVNEAMRIERINTQGMWVRRAALMWAAKIVAEDRGITAMVSRALKES